MLDALQIEEVLPTGTQTLMGVAMVLALRFHRRTGAWSSDRQPSSRGGTSARNVHPRKRPPHQTLPR
jgi:hypothetical protein